MANKSWLLKLLVCGAVVAAVTGCPESRDNESLFLTPFLDKDDIQTARTLSEVHLGRFNSVLYSHAGFITVDRQLGNHLFFWHFPSHVNKDAPLLMWLNGGPAVSSMLGLFWKHGPLEVNREKYGDSYTRRNHTWVGPLSVVYVDNPVGTGFSFSDMGEKGYKLTQDGYTHDLYNFVLQFFKLFPEYKSRQFYIGGQSYAGKYVPALAHRIHKHRHNESAEIPLTGIILGGPYFDPPTESVAFFDYLYALGAISHADMERHKTKVKSMYNDFVQQGGIIKNTFSELFTDLVLLKELPLPSLDNYVTGKSADYKHVSNIMNSSEIRKAVHVKSCRSYFSSNDVLSELYGPDVFVSTKPQMGVIMDNYKVLIYNGDYDVVVSSAMIEAALMSTNWSLQGQYNNTRRKIWKTDDRLKGFVSHTGQFCRVVVHGAGHQTPHDMPDTSLEMVTSFLKYGCVKPEN
jgi:vitellogenic carboxypeptidase-like protein